MSFETMHPLRRVPEATPFFPELSVPELSVPELSVVVTLRDTATDGGVTVAAGSRGTIVEAYAAGEAYEVEFAPLVAGTAA